MVGSSYYVPLLIISKIETYSRFLGIFFIILPRIIKEALVTTLEFLEDPILILYLLKL
jgi:hypothetical protein